MPNSLFPFIWYFLKNYKGCVIATLIVALLAAIETSIGPYLLKVIIDVANRETNQPQAFLSAILWPAIFYLSVPLIHNLTFRLQGYAVLVLFPALRTDITSKMFDYLSLQSNNYFQQHFSGSLSSKILDMSQGVEKILAIIHEMMMARMLAILIACGLLYTVNPIFSVVLLVWASIYLLYARRLSKKFESYIRVFSETYSTLSGQMVDSVSNIASAKIFANVGLESKRITEGLNDLAKKDRVLQFYFLKVNFIQGLWYFLFFATMLVGVIYGRMHEWITLGDFAFVLGLSIAINDNVNAIAQGMPLFSKEIGKCQQALSTIIVPLEIQDSTDAKPLVISKGSIEFENVNFGYVPGKPVFEHISLSIPPGQKVGLVGFSGGGKSTFASLILRLYDIQSGAIKIDNQNIKQVTLDSLRRQIAMMPQDPGLFNRSILDNIRYGRIEASEAEVIDAAKKAHCHEFIEQLNDGYHSLIGERGVKLSGGQKQRIAIARAILKEAPILILDEATSALDSVTEKYIQDSLEGMMQNKTVIAIAHRLSTLSKMDRILFLQEGKVVEDGTLEELREGKGLFAKLWNMQQEGFIPMKLTEVFLRPARFFKTPWEVMESMEYSDKDKLQILRTWKFDILIENPKDRFLPDIEKILKVLEI